MFHSPGRETWISWIPSCRCLITYTVYVINKALVTPRTSVHFPAHLFSSKNLSTEITPRRLRTRERGAQTLQLLLTQPRRDANNPRTHEQWNAPGELDVDLTTHTGLGPALALAQLKYTSVCKTFIFWKLTRKSYTILTSSESEWRGALELR